MKKVLIGILIGVIAGGIVVFVYNKASQKSQENLPTPNQNVPSENPQTLPETKKVVPEPENISDETHSDTSLASQNSPQTTNDPYGTPSGQLPTSDRFWSLESTDYTLSQTGLSEFWQNAPGEAYTVCMKDDPERCTRLVQYEGTMKEYVLEHYKYMFRDGSYTPSAEELEEFQRFAPAVTREFDTNYRSWKFGTWGNEFVGGAFTESPKGLIVIYEDAGSGMGFNGQDVQALAGRIEVK